MDGTPRRYGARMGACRAEATRRALDGDAFVTRVRMPDATIDLANVSFLPRRAGRATRVMDTRPVPIARVVAYVIGRHLPRPVVIHECLR